MHRDAVVGGLLALLSLFLLWKTGEIPHPPLIPIGPAFYPRVILAIFLVLSLLLVVSGFRAQAVPQRWSWRAWFARYRVILGCFVVFCAYVLALPILGYLLATALFTVVMQWLLGRHGLRRLPGVLAVAIGTSLGTYFIFELYLYVLLPRGILVR